MIKTPEPPSLTLLLVIMIVNYLAQIPYFLHNYYFPHHIIPGLRAGGLLGFTLIWFIVGYIAFKKKMKHGYAILISFLIVQALFYAMALLSGAFIIQLRNHSALIKGVFLIGYISGITAAYFAWQLMRTHRHHIVSV